MSEKKKVSVQIEGRSYSLITTDDEKYVKSVAEEVTTQLREIIVTGKQLDMRDCAVLAALNFCDDRNKALRKNKDYVSQADKIIRRTDELNKTCAEYKEKLAESINENTALHRKLRDLERETSALAKENEILKSALDALRGDSPESDSGKAETPAENPDQYSLFCGTPQAERPRQNAAYRQNRRGSNKNGGKN